MSKLSFTLLVYDPPMKIQEMVSIFWWEKSYLDFFKRFSFRFHNIPFHKNHCNHAKCRKYSVQELWSKLLQQTQKQQPHKEIDHLKAVGLYHKYWSWLVIGKRWIDNESQGIKKGREFTQCTDIQTAIAFALIRLGKISGRRRPGTGPAPKANVKTNLYI